MPRYANMFEDSNAAANWYQNQVGWNLVNTADSTDDSQTNNKNIGTAKVGGVWCSFLSQDEKKTSSPTGFLYATLAIGALTLGVNINVTTLTTSYVTKAAWSAHDERSHRATQAQVDAATINYTAPGSIGKSQYVDVINRYARVYYNYEHKVGGSIPMNLGAIGGVSFNKVWKIGRRSQISGTADCAYLF